MSYRQVSLAHSWDLELSQALLLSQCAVVIHSWFLSLLQDIGGSNRSVVGWRYLFRLVVDFCVLGLGSILV